MNKKNIIFIVAILIIATVVVVWWQTKPQQSQKYTGPVEKIRFAASRAGLELASLVWIADNQGYFKDQGLDVEITQEVNALIGQEKVAAGDADIANTSDFAFVSDSFTINNLKIFATIDQARVVDVVAKRDSGINYPSDLKGKKIAVTSKVAPDFFLNEFLINNNILPSQVSIINMPMADQQEAILNGEVDAVSTNDPYVYNIKTALGENGIDWPAQGNQTVFWVVVANEQFLKTHPEAVSRFVKSLLLAENFLKANPEKSKQIVENKFNLGQEYFEQNWPKHKFIISLSQSLILILNNDARWMVTNKLTNKTEIPNYLDYIYTDALEAVKPEAVTIIK